MELRRIVSSKDEDLKQLVELYIESFPPTERRPVEQLNSLIDQKKEMYFNVLLDEGVVAGLFVYWDLGDFYYLEHLAVYPEMRNRKIGQRVLEYIETELEGERLLEVEPSEDELTTRRIKFYERNNYKIIEKNYIQKPYDGRGEGIVLWIMGNTDYKDRAVLDAHIRTIIKEAYELPLKYC